MSDASAGHVGDKHVVRNGIIIATAGGLLASLLLEPVRAFVGSVWRLVTAAPGAVWSVLTASVPVWVLLAAVVAIAFVLRRTGQRAAPIAKVYDPATGTVGPPRVDRGPAAPPVLSKLEDAIVRRLAKADGEWLSIEDLSPARTSQLRIDQALEHLEDGLGLVDAHPSAAVGTLYGLTGRGRDLVIARGDA